MAIGVVNRFEVIKVNIHQSKAFSATAIGQPVQDMIKRTSVFQAGQCVREGPFLGRHARTKQPAVQAFGLLQYHRLRFDQIEHFNGRIGRCKILAV